MDEGVVQGLPVANHTTICTEEESRDELACFFVFMSDESGAIDIRTDLDDLWIVIEAGEYAAKVGRAGRIDLRSNIGCARGSHLGFRSHSCRATGDNIPNDISRITR